MAKAEKIVTKICNYECPGFCPHKATCPRGQWHIPAFQTGALSKHGIDTECPLMQFNIKQQTANKPLPTAYNISIDDTWTVCEHCKYYTNSNGCSPIFEKHCIDCPCYGIRDALEENAAEARLS